MLARGLRQSRNDGYLRSRVAHAICATWEDPPEVLDPPPLSLQGADHAEVPDPPRLLEVGWRTGR